MKMRAWIESHYMDSGQCISYSIRISKVLALSILSLVKYVFYFIAFCRKFHSCIFHSRIPSVPAFYARATHFIAYESKAKQSKVVKKRVKAEASIPIK